MDELELAFAGAARQAELLAAGEVSSRELTELSLRRIERIDPRINAFVALRAEQALEEADAADRRIADGERAALLGVPIAVKDAVDLAGMPTGFGSRAFPDPVAADGDEVRRVRSAGAVIVGKTTLPELAICAFTESLATGATRNPWDPSRTCGGSSGGSGAATAAGLVGVAGAADGAGSTRIPAACNGLFGIKPSKGLIPVEPADHWSGMSNGGGLGRRVADVALYCDTIAHGAPGDAESFSDAISDDASALRIAFTTSAPRTLVSALVTAEVRRAVEETAALLESLGHEVHAEDPSWGLAGQNLSTRYLGGIREETDRVERKDLLEPRTRGIARLGRLSPGFLVARAAAAAKSDAARVDRVFERADVLLCPTIGEPPPEVGRWAESGGLSTVLGMAHSFGHTAHWNHMGHPAASVPAGFTAEGLPLAVQIVAPHGHDGRLMALAARLEAARPWADRRPALATHG
ncbi:hypothetical protein HJD18_04730 [Thermoleophilia bacterium SCSIO 60948]|nr:hypothetical protein HJD18_04730 [Thermoleophilia bacterium SCSIO 60948]